MTPGAHLDLLLPSGRMREYFAVRGPRRRRWLPHRGAPDSRRRRIDRGARDTAAGRYGANQESRQRRADVGSGHGSPAQHIRFVAGGIGMAPVLPMMRAAQRLGLAWSMSYIRRFAESIPFIAEVTEFGDKVAVRTDDVRGMPRAADPIGKPRCPLRCTRAGRRRCSRCCARA